MGQAGGWGTVRCNVLHTIRTSEKYTDRTQDILHRLNYMYILNIQYREWRQLSRELASVVMRRQEEDARKIKVTGGCHPLHVSIVTPRGNTQEEAHQWCAWCVWYTLIMGIVRDINTTMSHHRQQCSRYYTLSAVVQEPFFQCAIRLFFLTKAHIILINRVQCT